MREILECIEAVDRAEMAMARFAGDLDVGHIALDAVRFRLLTIGDAVRLLSRDLREDHPAVTWSEMERLPDLISSQHSIREPNETSRHDVTSQPDSQPEPQVVLATIREPLRHLRRACLSILGESVRIGEDEP
jgi:uncharacterized protein with HEPN domain